VKKHILNDRKIEHINIIGNDGDVDRRKHYFDDVHLLHRALPELNFSDIDPSTEFMGKHLSFPLLISSMTGGDNDLIKKINKNLALAAEATKVAMGVGSQRVMFAHTEARSSFDIRKYAPKTLLLSNLGAVQLNYELTSQSCVEAVEAVGADGIFLHLNPLQEIVQHEGNTDFSGLCEKIGDVVKHVNFPVVVKEVGSGISEKDAKLLIAQNVKYIDVAGSGGTSWSRIEHFRQSDKNEQDQVGITFQDWGIPTPVAVRALSQYKDRITLIASGGIRNGIDMVKAMILGASMCGMATPFLQPAMDSCEEVIKVIQNTKLEFTVAMFLLGIKNTQKIIGNESLLRK
jgi:isopentenyl-diphosphate delta-isomerase